MKRDFQTHRLIKRNCGAKTHRAEIRPIRSSLVRGGGKAVSTLSRALQSLSFKPESPVEYRLLRTHRGRVLLLWEQPS